MMTYNCQCNNCSLPSWMSFTTFNCRFFWTVTLQSILHMSCPFSVLNLPRANWDRNNVFSNQATLEKQETVDIMKNVADRIVSYKKEYLRVRTSPEVRFFFSITDTLRIDSESDKGLTGLKSYVSAKYASHCVIIL